MGTKYLFYKTRKRIALLMAVLMIVGLFSDVCPLVHAQETSLVSRDADVMLTIEVVLKSSFVKKQASGDSLSDAISNVCTQNSINSTDIKELIILSGTFTTDDWRRMKGFPVSAFTMEQEVLCEGEMPSFTPDGAESFFSSSLESFVIHTEIPNIVNSAFYWCQSLEVVDLSGGVKAIGYNAFNNCSSLRQVIFPEGLQTIGGNAFANDRALQNVVLPESLETISSSAFSGCNLFTKITIPSGVKNIGSGIFYNCTGLTEVVIPEDSQLDVVESSVFNGCSKLKTIRIPSVIKTIKSSAFSDCTALKEVTMSADITLEPGVFSDCSSLDTLNIVTTGGDTVSLVTVASSANPFYGLPDPRYLAFCLEDGTPLSEATRPMLSVAKETYANVVDNNPTDGKWYGWEIEKTYAVTFELTNIESSNTSKSWRPSGGDYTTTLFVKETSGKKFRLPQTIEVLIGGWPIDEEGYQYNYRTGQVTIDSQYIESDITIIADAIDITPESTPMPTTSPTAAPTTNPTVAPTVSPVVTSSVALTPAPTISPLVLPTAVPTLSPAKVPDVSPALAPTISPLVLPTSIPTTTVPTATQTPDKDLADLIGGLGVSGETAGKIQKVAEELDISRDTILVTDETITSQKTDEDIKGSYYSRIQARAAQTSEGDIRLVWNGVRGADGYRIYSNRCNTRKHIYEYKLTKTITNGNKKSYVQRKCKKGTYYKFIVRAYKNIDGKRVTIAVSKTIHATTLGGKYGNPQTVRLKQKKVSVKTGGTFRIKAKEVRKNKPLRHHREIKYESSNPKIATVSRKGVVRGIKAGKCTIFAYAQNGFYKKLAIKIRRS